MTRRRSGRWPYRQADRRWADDKMWMKDKLVGVHQSVNGASAADVAGWLFGDTIETDGCLLTCLAMTLRLLAPRGARWTPGTLNRAAKDLLYYSDAGLSIVPLYADLVADVTHGRVQLCAQERYFSGEKGQRRRTPSLCCLLRAYRNLPESRRVDFVVMLKIGTHDDNFASHYVLVDPDWPGLPDDNDIAILDPDQPEGPRATSWCLSDSYQRLAATRQDIAVEWRRCRIRVKKNQLAAAWAFARWPKRDDRCLAGDLLRLIAEC